MNLLTQQAKIAEFAGWTNLQERADDCGTFGLWGTPPSNNATEERPVPFFPSCLNAMHRVIQTLTLEEHGEYRRILSRITSERDDTTTRLMSNQEYRNWFEANAAQKSEALLKTLNLWEDPKAE